MEVLLSQEFVDYGYRKVTYWLRKTYGYIINEKKVYRLLKEHKLLTYNRKGKRRGSRNWVKELVPQPSEVLNYLEFDIKYVFIHGKRRNALLLSVIDVKSRWVLGQLLKWSIDQYDVKRLFDKIFSHYNLPKGIYVRNDNGSQFESKLIQDYFKDKQVVQEFTLPATPEQNAHIEAYHSILERAICRKFELDDLKDAQEVWNRWIRFYNFDRIHSGLNYLAPQEYLKDKGVFKEPTDQLMTTLNCIPFSSL